MNPSQENREGFRLSTNPCFSERQGFVDWLGFSQEKLAAALGTTQSSLNRYEHAQSTPTAELFRKYADYFDVSLDYIFARTDNP